MWAKKKAPIPIRKKISESFIMMISPTIDNNSAAGIQLFPRKSILAVLWIK